MKRTIQGATMPERMRCPKCGESRKLSLIETLEVGGSTDFGEIRLDARGALMPPSDFWYNPGEQIALSIECGRCRHQWKPRRQTISLERPEPHDRESE